MNLRILTSAVRDLAAGREFYEAQESGLGNYFLDTLFSDIETLKLYGGIHRKVMGFHRLLSNRFPHAIYYRRDKDGDVIVFRVLDCRRNPATIRRELKSI